MSKFTRGFLVFLVIFIVLYTLATGLLIPAAKNIFLATFPPKDLPKPIYGLLDPLEFTPKQLQTPPQSYTINTRDGKLPESLPKQMVVYKVKPSEQSFEAGKKARDSAKILGFSDQNLTSDLKGTSYKWRNIETGGVLDININSRILKLLTPLVGKSSYFSTGGLNKKKVTDAAINLFRSLNRFDDGLYSKGTQKVAFGKYVGSQVYETVYIQEAQIARVDLFRSINKIPVLGPDAKKGMLSAVVRDIPPNSESTAHMNYPIVDAYYWEINQESNATYPLIPISQAWEAVKSNTAVVSNTTPKGANPFIDYNNLKIDSVIINDIYLAYYDNFQYQKYLQPIYVFEGNYLTSGTVGGSITYYFPAIEGQYIKQPLNQQPKTQKPK